MGRKGGTKHLKRLPAPAFWPIHVKEFKWAIRPNPGPHVTSRSIPLSLVLREILRYGKTRRESKMILSKRAVKVDGKIRRDGKYPVGLMDVVEVPDAKSVFRMVPFPSKGLSLLKITKDEAGFKLCIIDDRVSIDGGRIQLSLSDGRNIILPQQVTSTGESYNTGDTLQIGIPSQKIMSHIKFAEGKYGLAVAGRNIGKHGRIVGIEKASATRRATVKIQDVQGRTFQTVTDYVYAVGDEKPIIRLPEG